MYLVCLELVIRGHRKICVPSADTCEHWLHASCELKKSICGHLHAEQSSCVQIQTSELSICKHQCTLLRCCIFCQHTPVGNMGTWLKYNYPSSLMYTNLSGSFGTQ